MHQPQPRLLQAVRLLDVVPPTDTGHLWKTFVTK